ncbi:MAG: hypothetical protein HYX46_07365 [Betaproteobacteria bacterium]|nr:hypothetical protein [Betaproteobacteria bacterium]
MDRVAALAALDRRMLEAFSGRTVDRLRAALPLRVALPHLEPFLALNVAKEIRKDALVIREAAEALARGVPPAPEAARRVLEATRQIDREFLREIGRFPVRIEIPYERIAPLRLQRIERGLDAAYRILQAWGTGGRLRGAFPRAQFERRLLELLRLYVEETGALSHSVRLPALVAPVRDLLGQRLRRVMSDVARSLAGDIAAALYRRRA